MSIMKLTMLMIMIMIIPGGVVVIIASIYRIILSISGAYILEEIVTVNNNINTNFTHSLILAFS